MFARSAAPVEQRLAPRPAPSGRPGPSLLRRLRSRIALAPGERRAIEVITPFTGEVLGWIPHGTAEDIREAARRGRAAQAVWSRVPLRERSRIFLRFHDLLLGRQAEVLDLIQLESGKARLNAFEEVVDTANGARYYAARAHRFLRPRRRRGLLPGLTRAREYRHPLGLVGFITPWNYPLNLGITDAMPALIAGNAALLKPDHQTSLTTLWAVDLLHQAGLPPHLVSVVTGLGPELGPPLIDSVDFVMFTGSVRTGRIVAQQAGERLIGCSLELGGKNPMIVLADADWESAVEAAVRGCFVGAGQVCVSIERIYVQAEIFERFVSRFVERTRALRLGAALDYGADVGSLASARQLETVQDHVCDAVQKGAALLCGGTARPDLGPFFFEPTVLSGVREGMKVFAEETFGPVVAVYPFDTKEEGLERANASRFGLNASVWTRRTSRAWRIATSLQVGSVNINEGYGAVWGSVDAPIGGFKESGLGRRHGAPGILTFTQSQSVAMQRAVPLAPVYDINPESYARLFTRVLQLFRRVPGLR
jgi:succinate-semialdehyde dehydrogenase / glutarate-semialdehyde dehydrogenase